MRFVAFGRTKMLHSTIEALVASGHVPRLIGTCRASTESPVKSSDFAELAARLGVDFFDSAAINSDTVFAALARADADVAVSVNWLTVVGARVCGLFRHGVLNAHAGDLPRYRGNAPYAYAILQKEPFMGVCIHRMEPGVLDSGPVLVRRRVRITEAIHVGDLIETCERLVPDMFCDALRGLDTGTITPLAQPTDPALALRCYPRKPEDCLINWSRPAAQICRLVRASSRPFSGAFTFFEGRRVTIWRAHAEPSPSPYLGVPGQVVERRASGEVLVLTPEGFVVIEEMSGADGTIIVPSQLVKSLRQRFGFDPLSLYEQLRSEIDYIKRRCSESSQLIGGDGI